MTNENSNPPGASGPGVPGGSAYTQLYLDIDLGPLVLKAVDEQPGELETAPREIPGQLTLFDVDSTLEGAA